MGTPITLKTMKADTRDAVIDTLAKTWPLNARQVYSEVRDTQHLNITYQGVHKVLNQLVKEKIAVTQDRKYELDAAWIKSLRKFAETADKNYSKSTSAPYLEIGTGSSVEKDAFTAGKEAAEKAIKQIKSKRELQLALVFAASVYEANYEDLLKGVRAITKTAPLAGCTTMGEINDKSLHKSVVVAIFAAEKETFSAETIAMPLEEQYQERNNFTRELQKLEVMAEFKKQMPNLGIVFFPGYEKENGMKVIAPTFLSEYANKFSTPFPIIGCLAGDDWAFNKTYQFFNAKALTDTVVFVAIKTKLAFGIRRVHGLKPVNTSQYKLRVKNCLVTEMAKIQDNKIYKYAPVLDLYIRETGITLKTLQDSVPLFLRELIGQNRTPTITRLNDGAHGYPTFIEGKAIRFDNAFNDGDMVQITRTTPEEIVTTTRNSITEATKIGKIGKIAGVLLISCASLEAVLNTHKLNEIERIKPAFMDIPLFGCYNAGEIGPMAVPQGSGTVVALVFGNELRE